MKATITAHDTLSGHLKQLFTLAVPVVISQASHTLVGLADSILVGRTNNTEALAAISLANSVFVVIVVAGIGLTMGLTPLIAQAYGEGRKEAFSGLLSNSLVLFGLFSLVCIVVGYPLAAFAYYLKQDPGVIATAVPVFRVLLISTLPVLLFQAFRNTMEGIGKPRVPAIISVVGNVLNILLNIVLVYGTPYTPAYGALGSAIATLIARMCMLLAIWVYFYGASDFKAIRFNVKLVSARPIGSIFKLGAPSALQLFFEVGAFSGAAIMVGWLGAIPLAAHQIAISVASFTYMGASGLASASTVLVAYFKGKGESSQINLIAKSSYLLVIGYMTVCALLLFFFKYEIASAYINVRPVVQLGAFLLVFAAIFQLADGVQVVGLGLLRGIGDVNIPTLITLVAYWVVALPLGYYFGFILDMNAAGVWLALSFGLLFAAAALYWRFKLQLARLAMSSTEKPS